MFIDRDFSQGPSALDDRDQSRPLREVRSIRLRRMEIGGEKRQVSIRLVETSERIQAARDLINDRYAWRGYGSNHHIVSDAHHMTFTAEIDDQVIGTITLAVDSPRGLAADRAFKDEVDGFRALSGVKVCELTKFAFDPAVQSKELMAALFHIVFVYGYRTHGCTDLLIEVNPRHVRFYETMLGFARVGAVRTNEGVAAPAQLMRLRVAAIREQINLFAGSKDQARSRSLYPFFFSPDDEEGIYQRLARAETTTAPAEEQTYHAAQIANIAKAMGALPPPPAEVPADQPAEPVAVIERASRAAGYRPSKAA